MRARWSPSSTSSRRWAWPSAAGHPDDRRQHAVHLTAQGRRTLERARKVAFETAGQIFDPLDEREMAAAPTKSLLRKLARANSSPAGSRTSPTWSGRSRRHSIRSLTAFVSSLVADLAIGGGPADRLIPSARQQAQRRHRGRDLELPARRARNRPRSPPAEGPLRERPDGERIVVYRRASGLTAADKRKIVADARAGAAGSSADRQPGAPRAGRPVSGLGSRLTAASPTRS